MLKRNITVIILSFALILSMLTANVMADDELLQSNQNTFDISQGSVKITSPGEYTIGGTSDKYTVVITEDSTVTLDNLNLSILANSPPIKIENCNVTLILKGNNTIVTQKTFAGIEVNSPSSLTIKGDGALSVTSGTENDKSTNAQGAAIGSSNGLDCGEITIESGTITTLIYGDAASIGSGSGGDVSRIHISGGTVNASACRAHDTPTCGAAIGAGSLTAHLSSPPNKGNGGEIIIDGSANVTAKNGALASYVFGLSTSAAAIGGAENKGANITIAGNARVDAYTRSRAAAIGAGLGNDGSQPNTQKNTIHISGNAVVNAKAEQFQYDGLSGAAIGTSALISYNQPMDIIIDGSANVTANAYFAAGIGCGAVSHYKSASDCPQMNVVIGDNAVVRSDSFFGNSIGIGVIYSQTPESDYDMSIDISGNSIAELSSLYSQAIGDVMHGNNDYDSIRDPSKVNIAETATLKAYSNCERFAIREDVAKNNNLLNLRLTENDIFPIDYSAESYKVHLVNKNDYSLLNTLNIPLVSAKDNGVSVLAGYLEFAGTIKNCNDVFVVNTIGTTNEAVNCAVYKAESDTIYRYQGDNRQKDNVTWELFPTITYIAGANGSVSLAGELIDKYHFSDPIISDFKGCTAIANGDYAFDSWTSNKAPASVNNPIDKISVDAFVFDSDKNLKSAVFTANFKEKPDTDDGGIIEYCTLIYESCGNIKYPTQQYAKNEIVSLDKLPLRDGYEFTGWYADIELTQKITDTVMNCSKTVYAGWKENADSKQDTVPTILNGKDHYAYVQGYTNDTVRPLDNISRAEVSTIFFRLLKDEVREKNLTYVNNFADVAPDAWYNTPISTMSALGIVNGRSESRFEPNASITRAEFAAICARFDQSAQSSLNSFNDIYSHWAKTEIEHAAALNWINGYTDGSFRPNQPITRAEAMALINRVLCRHVNTSADLLPNMNMWSDNADVTAWYYFEVQEATNSHTYILKSDGKSETWTALIPNKIWDN